MFQDKNLKKYSIAGKTAVVVSFLALFGYLLPMIFFPDFMLGRKAKIVLAEDGFPVGEMGDEIRYGKDIISHTAKYFGPKGSVSATTNGMNCQNCHLDAGTRDMGNNYLAVASTYPKYRARSGAVEDIYKRVNDCFERSLNGKALDTNSKEMKAIVAYIQWIGKDVPKNTTPKTSGIVKLDYLDRPASPENGKAIYAKKCNTCHGNEGQGVLAQDGIEYTYPPLWGPNSYNSGAGLYRMSRFAGYVYHNMPFGATHLAPQLTQEEAWDLAAFVNSQPHPNIDISIDWPKIEEKPVDHPFGPFADSFSENQHKFGPFAAIVKQNKSKK